MTSRFVVQVWEVDILRFWESNLSGTIINSQTFFQKAPSKDLKEGPVYKAKGTTWPSKLKYIPGSVLTKFFETICSLVMQSYILPYVNPFLSPRNFFMKMMTVAYDAAYCVQISFSKLIVSGMDSPSFLRTLWS